MYIIVGVFRVVLILIDEVHHFIIGALALANAGFLTPFFDGITDGVIHVFANVVEVAARGTDATLLGKEVSFIMHMEYFASTFYLTITYGKFVAQHLVQFVEEQVAGRPCAFGVERQQTSVLVILKLSPIDLSTD